MSPQERMEKLIAEKGIEAVGKMAINTLTEESGICNPMTAVMERIIAQTRGLNGRPQCAK